MTQPLIVALPTHAGDIDQAERLMKWIGELGHADEHSLLVAADSGLEQARVKALLDEARPHFHSVRAMIVNVGAKGWPLASNLVFRAVARQVQEFYSLPYLWLEPDAVPLRAAWLANIAEAYRLSPRPFMGQVIDNPDVPEGLPKRYISGIAVYPNDTYGRIGKGWQDARFTGPSAPTRAPDARNWVRTAGAWDMSFAEFLVPRTQHTALIQSHWGTSYSTPPVFKTARTEADPMNVVTLDFIRSDAAVFHRIKDVDAFLALWRVRLEFNKALVVEARHGQTKEPSREIDEALGPAAAVPAAQPAKRKTPELATV